MVLLRLPVLGRSTIRRVRPDQQRLQPPLDGLTVREQLAFDAAACVAARQAGAVG